MLDTIYNQITKLTKYGKMLSFWDVKRSINKMDFAKIGFCLLLDLVNSFAKILAPAALAKAVEMYALNEENFDVGLFDMTAKELLYASLLFSVWVKGESQLKNFLIRGMEQKITEKHSLQVIKLTHRVSFEEHLTLRSGIPNLLMDIINLHSKLISETVAVVYQVLFDVTLSTIILWNRYGSIIGLEFLAYCFVDFFLLSQVVTCATKQQTKFVLMNKALQKYLNREFEVLSLAETIRMFNHEKLELKLSHKALTKYLIYNNQFLKSEQIASCLKLLPFLFASWIPLSFILKEDISISDLDDFIFLVSYLNIISGNMASLTQAVKSYSRAAASVDQMNNLIRQQQPHRTVAFPTPYINLPSFGLKCQPPTIQLVNVSFGYPDQDEPVLKNINLTIEPGTTLGIVGRSGVGKSTLVKLLYGLYEPQTGSILINGHNIRTIPRRTLGKIFCCVPQTVCLFKGSLKYNVLYGAVLNSFLRKYLEQASQQNSVGAVNYGSLNASELEEIQPPIIKKADKLFSKAIEQAGLANLNTFFANHKASAEALSGGQRQRVGIARALTRNAPVLILDEAFSAQDSFTKGSVFNTIQKLKDTTGIIITHDLTNVRDVDEVIVLEGGSIVERGSHESLLEEKGLYYEYWNAQRC